MIQITKGTTNNVALTLTEKCTLTSPYYLFVFQSDETRNLYKFIAADTSTHPDRYNLFAIVETDSSPDPLAGEIELPIVGFYKYKVYEQTSSTNLNPALATGIVEVGKVQVIDTPAADDKLNNTNNINYVYNE
jgi:hypothetical protein